MGLTVVAEGIETEAHLALVQQCGVDVVQGYYLGRPIDAAKVSELFYRGEVYKAAGVHRL